MINNGRGPSANQDQATENTVNQAGEEARGDVLVHGLWETESRCALDICISDTDAKSYADKSSKTVLERAPSPCRLCKGRKSPTSP